ncbi:hypothetical protein [Paractinoplanes atraurantiacus]|uniref:Lipoprotein n=1 Tax=Paractinoplanes atraurantiacus TaxID=1036182 RepID=A0A285J348_9ACTN|nr:hypothetical protein [Actinoplanes atraurantiacus]SNY54750.1 hypothetical protein SAMN05421748_115148 [Actinoplanes atraurantiacus]
MSRRWWAVLTVAVCLAGCGEAREDVKQPEVAVSVSLPADPKAALAVGLGKLGTQSARVGYRFNSEGYEVRYTAVVDAAGTTWEATGDRWVLRRIGNDVWVKVTKADDLGLVPADQLDKWLKMPLNYLDTTSFKTGFPWSGLRNAAEVATGITRTGDRTYEGKLPDDDLTVSLDAAGRFTRVMYGDFMEMTYSDFGTPVAVEPPAATEEAVFQPAAAGIM